MMIKHESRWRKLILVLFIICMLGPWAFELLNVPAQYPCEKPSVRLTGDFCGYPFLGFEAFILAVSNLFYILRELIKGNFTPYVTEYLFLIYPWIMILPFFSTLLLLWKKNARQLQTINLTAWGLACLTTLPIFVLQASRAQVKNSFYLLWGIWLYILMAFGAIVFEIMVIRSSTNMKVSSERNAQLRVNHDSADAER